MIDCDRLINDLNCCVVTVHHTGKAVSAGARGHSSYFAALTTEIKVEALGNFDIVVKNTKQKDFREFETLQFVKVETGNSIKLEPVIVSKGNQRSKLTGNEKLLILRVLIGSGGWDRTNDQLINSQLLYR